MESKNLLLALGIGLALAQSSCIVVNTTTPCSQEENMIEKSINLSSFDAIDVSASEVVFKVGDENKIVYTVCEPIADKVVIETRNKKLNVGIKGNRENHIFKCEITSTNHLKDIDASGACKFRYEGDIVQQEMDIDISGATTLTIDGSIKVEDLDIETSGASKFVAMNVECGKLDVDVSGASQAELKGKCRNASYDVSGASKISASNMIVQDAVVNASGASDIDMSAIGNVKKSASGVSHISVKKVE